MAYCSKCGAEVAGDAAFCSKCGVPQRPASAPPAVPAPTSSSGMSENTAGLLCYLFGWLTGIIFFLIDKRPFVRFHAAQSIVVFGGLHIIHHVIALIIGVHFLRGGWSDWTTFAPGVLGLHLINLLTFVLWILLMVKAHQGERFKIPIAWEIAEGMAGK